MAKVHFAPSVAIRYVGAKQKEFAHSLARPKPVLKRGDIVIVDKKTAFNLVQKGYDQFVNVDEIEFVKANAETAETIKELKSDNETLKARIAELEALVPSADPHKEDDSADNAGEDNTGVDTESGEI